MRKGGGDMKKITKEMCAIFVRDYNKSKPIFLIFISIFALVALWVLTKNIVVVALSAVLLLVLTIRAVYIVNQKIKDIDLSSFYLVEDVIVEFKKRHTHSKASGSGHNYIYTFRDNGEYTIHKSAHTTIEVPLHKEKYIDNLSVEKMCIESCEKGDMYYLLVLKKKECSQIIKCFPKYNFDIAQEDFDFIDGKYYCKK